MLFLVLQCQLYEDGVVDGNLCSKLCRTKTLQIHNCYDMESNYRVKILQVFYTNQTVIKVHNNRFRESALDRYELDVIYRFPEEGSHMEHFRVMVKSFLNHKLARGDHLDLVTKLMDYADCNHDGKVSLAEAKSLWALLQHTDFLVAFVFQASEYIPKLLGSCGDLFALERVSYPKLYDRNNSSWLSYLFPNSYTWNFPSWHNRGRVAVSLLEFALDAYQHDSEASFHMCDLQPSTIGHNSQYDVRVIELKNMITQRELAISFSQTPCLDNANCVIGTTCLGSCNSSTAKCNPGVMRPNLYHICQLLQPYLAPSIPRDIKGDLMNLWDACFALSSNSSDLELNHSLVLINLKSLLWNEIS
ncbi:hypothetical protein CAPTEDRAFT_174120 [Capitella teleta]|uniref:EF-hand domain-containing protein n=1 Tax=Capitella teleta TaxID=283909 RepID=R7UVG2_CAPTE|nr:hypothetical protein CAPTEDRAFT_174120 [Capitella teleta]|eukprot:ELU07386.1 hypothetical protein CAPTEDRAFT_174120 [Capitella teleta]